MTQPGNNINRAATILHLIMYKVGTRSNLYLSYKINALFITKFE